VIRHGLEADYQLDKLCVILIMKKDVKRSNETK
jgi:hypothetical protein